jgi:hypothetical protein
MSNRLDFDPNKLKNNNCYATFVPYRTPNFKAHAHRAHALSALNRKNCGLLFKHDGFKWVEIGRFPSLLERDLQKEYCDRCGNKCRVYDNSFTGKVKIVEVGDDQFAAQFWCEGCGR